MIGSYSSIYALSHRAVRDILDGDVVVQEKIDGSQISFGVDLDGVLHVRSKGKELVLDAPEKMFEKAVAEIRSVQYIMVPGWTYRGEYLQKPKHNVLAYSRVPQHNIILFDIDRGDQDYRRPAEVEDDAYLLDMEVVPTLFNGKLTSLNQVTAMFPQESILGGVKPEGLVVKNYNKFTSDHKVLMAKFVTAEFKESHQNEWGVSNPGKGDVVQKLIEGLRTEARWNKAIQHLREAGILVAGPQDIGPLLKEIGKDTHTEEREQIMEALFDWAWPQISRGITAGFPQWYKDRLTQQVFAEV